MPNYNNYPMAVPNQYPMAYNQQPYYQNSNAYGQYNSYGQQMMQPQYQTAAPIKQFVDWVSGKTAADVYRAEPGTRAYLMDSTAQYFYVKETGLDGRPSPLMAFKYEAAQTARLLADNAAQTQALEQYLNPVPIPAYQVQNPNCCNNFYNGYSCGCNG